MNNLLCISSDFWSIFRRW